MLNFYLFRIKIHEPPLPSMFDEEKSASERIREVILSKPSEELRKGFIWHIGNVIELKENGLYFALGRTTKTIVELYDEDEGNFVEEDFESSPYTHAFVDLTYQLLSIAKKTRLAQTPKGISKQLERLMNSAQELAESGRSVEILQISDPEEFINHIRNAYSVSKFTMEFGEPNPWDANEDFQAPMQKLLKESHGRKGRTSISGEDLKRETLEDLTRASAATGNDVQALIKSSQDERGVIKHLVGNPATVSEDEVASDEHKITLLLKVRKYYIQIRQHLGNKK